MGAKKAQLPEQLSFTLWALLGSNQLPPDYEVIKKRHKNLFFKLLQISCSAFKAQNVSKNDFLKR